jgi:hypothetical protein
MVMKGVVFVEFLRMVKEKYSIQTSQELINISVLPSQGVYKPEGTYGRDEMVVLVDNLSKLTNVAAAQIFKDCGKYLFLFFVAKFPQFFTGMTSSLAFLPHVQHYVHLEVKKIFPDAELPTFICTSPNPGTLIMRYQSASNLPDLAEGLIEGCIGYFHEQYEVERSQTDEIPPTVVFRLCNKGYCPEK